MSARSSSPQTLSLTQLSQVTSRAKVDPSLSVLIYDRKLESISAEFRKFAKSFPIRYAVESGEQLKNLDRFPLHCQRLARLAATLPARQMTVVAAGGGSVGDFAGFFASVYKRGVRLVHLPTTWLAAIDSSHGGKTALNVTGAKNQIGTFYPAHATVVVRSILSSQPPARIEDAMGELAKVAMIDGGAWVKKLEATPLGGEALLLKFLALAIEAKLKIVRRDPLEEIGLRQILNLGHTMGHVIEVTDQLSHGVAVAQGLFFALEFSRSEGFLSDAKFERAMNLMAHLGLAPKPVQAMSVKRLTQLLQKDKKRTKAGEITYVFLRAFGRCERQAISIQKLVREARRQGWVA